MGITTVQLRKGAALGILIWLSVSLSAPAPAACTIDGIVSIDSSLTYNFPPGFVGNATENFIDTMSNANGVAGLLSAAKNASFISYGPEFLRLIGKHPSLKLIAQRDSRFAHEAGIWVPVKNQVWFTSFAVNGVGNVSILDLGTSEIFTPKTSIPIVTPNGGYYFNGKVYITNNQGNAMDTTCIYEIDPSTYETTIIINSYFGLRFNGPNDVTLLKRGEKSYLFFTDWWIYRNHNASEMPALPNAVWRYDPQDKSIVPVISQAEVTSPNGIALNADMTKLYVTDTPLSGFGKPPSGSPAIYSFDLDEDLFPVKKRMLGIARNGIPDGMKIDDAGRIWTAEAEGIVVRDPSGKVIGLFNSETLLTSQSPTIANFALAGDTLVVLAVDRVWTLKLAETVISPDRYF